MGDPQTLPASKVDDLENVEAQSLLDSGRILSTMESTDECNALYQQCFQLLKIGGLEAEIPRLVVFGQQSMGKTTLLDFIMGGPIGYSSTTTGTKQPVVIMLRPPGAGDAGGETGGVTCRLDGSTIPIENLQQAMSNLMQAAGDRISDKELELEIVVPNGIHAVFVDLPGIKDDSKSGAQLTRNVVRNYVRHNPNDLYILVKKASDDPANWPWSLREFILSAPPQGLGLSARQTIVVGTRAKDFLISERNDVSSLEELQKRVKQRAVNDVVGQPLPLHLLELFSLSLDTKESTDFGSKKSDMFAQIREGRESCIDLINTGFGLPKNAQVKRDLLSNFDHEVFKSNLNEKFQTLLSEQVSMLERRLIRKRSEQERTISDLEKQLVEQNPQSVREAMRLFLRELMQVVTELVTGDYKITRLPGAGDAFLHQYGGNLHDNLEDGHKLAMELYPKEEEYDPHFLERMQRHSDLIFEAALVKKERQQMEEQQARLGSDASLSFIAERPMPDAEGYIQPGQMVRFTLTKDDALMLGFVRSLKVEADATKKTMEINPEQCQVTFFFQNPTPGARQHVQMQHRPTDRARLQSLIPMTHLVFPNALPPAGFRCWKRVVRSDGWIGLAPVAVESMRNISAIANSSPPPAMFATNLFSLDSVSVTIHSGEAYYRNVVPRKEGAKPRVVPESPFGAQTTVTTASPLLDGEPEGDVEQIQLEDLFVDANSVGRGPRGHLLSGESLWKTTTALQRIAGDFAETKLLNQLSLTYLGRWLKFHVYKLEPDRRLSSDVLLQMMRSVRHVVDKADWEPLVADLLQANVGSGLIPLARLASCATAVALRRILKAALSEVRRLVCKGDLSPNLLFLVNSTRFMEELSEALDEYCRERAINCSTTMCDLIFNQTHVIHFDVIEDLFDECSLFEHDLIQTSRLPEVSRDIRDALSARKQRLGVADIYARKLTSGINHDMIYEEVRVQFWAAKILLGTPLAMRLYMHFLKDVKDKSQHMASESKFQVSCESDVERALQTQLLCEKSATSDQMLPRTEDQLMKYYGLTLNRDELNLRIASAKRTMEYVKVALQGVSRLRVQMKKTKGVDFLTRLNLDTSKPSANVSSSSTLSNRSSRCTMSASPEKSEVPSLSSKPASRTQLTRA